jgi:hypothetical protein
MLRKWLARLLDPESARDSLRYRRMFNDISDAVQWLKPEFPDAGDLAVWLLERDGHYWRILGENHARTLPYDITSLRDRFIERAKQENPMADVKIIPRISCDNCGIVVEKRITGGSYAKPEDWGSVSVSATQRGTYPNDIRMNDLCINCLEKVHTAVTHALKSARQED